MTLLELVAPQPNWFDALGVALTRPPGVPERRAGENPMDPRPRDRPRRISDDLAWLRQAIDEPEANGLRPIEGSAAVAAWETTSKEPTTRLERLRNRRVLDAAGFQFHEEISRVAAV